MQQSDQKVRMDKLFFIAPKQVCAHTDSDVFFISMRVTRLNPNHTQTAKVTVKSTVPLRSVVAWMVAISKRRARTMVCANVTGKTCTRLPKRSQKSPHRKNRRPRSGNRCTITSFPSPLRFVPRPCPREIPICPVWPCVKLLCRSLRFCVKTPTNRQVN